MKIYSQSHTYEYVLNNKWRTRLLQDVFADCCAWCAHRDPWPAVTLAFFLRYPNRYASHVVTCDVIDRHLTPEGTLRTTRLLLKRGALPAWAPRGIMSRTESWIIEESEVDVEGKTVVCNTRNLDHVKVMQVRENVLLKGGSDGSVYPLDDSVPALPCFRAVEIAEC